MIAGQSLIYESYNMFLFHSWSDGSDVDYVNWNPGEPNDWDGQEACAEIEVFDGMYKYKFICF